MSSATAPGSGTDPQDREAVERFRTGGDAEGAITDLFRRHGGQTLAFFARRTGHRETAFELNQELWLAVVRSLGTFRGESGFRTWLFRMAHNELSNLRRRWRTHLDERPEEPPEGFWEGLRGDDDDPLEGIHGERLKAGLQRCLAALPEAERAVVVGQYYEGATLAELTQRLRLTNASGARALLLAAQRRLRRCLSGREEATR
jgi:RNA polymerase sigma-70 factor (ECF subfamily)